MYHINHEGKVYPCRARILKCPYGADMHAETKEELYYKIMSIEREVEVPSSVISEVSKIGRLKSLQPISKELETSPHPIETIITSLDYAINMQLRPNAIEKSENLWSQFVEKASEDVYECLKYGMPIPNYVSKDIERKGRQLFEERLGSTPIDYGISSRNPDALMTRIKLDERKEQHENYKFNKKFRLTKNNFDANLEWLQKDFERFSDDLNFSKTITRPLFHFDTIEEAGEKIKELSDYELLSAYDDYFLTNNERLDKANNFDFKDRDDLSKKANDNIRKWYSRNKSILDFWHETNPRLILISMKMAEELDRRGIVRYDNPLGRI
jgi:hypothetical protein